jgi:hypothetical protein
VHRIEARDGEPDDASARSEDFEEELPLDDPRETGKRQDALRD